MCEGDADADRRREAQGSVDIYTSPGRFDGDIEQSTLDGPRRPRHPRRPRNKKAADEGHDRQRKIKRAPRLLVLAAHEDHKSRHQRHGHDQALDQHESEGENISQRAGLGEAREDDGEEAQVSHAVFDVVDLEDVQDRGGRERGS